jgi:hypothetical protein
VLPEQQAACPVCGAVMELAAVNAHLDGCLAQGDSNSGMPKADNPRGQSGSSFANGNMADSVIVSDSEDDDDEPLAKRRGLDWSTEQVTKFSKFITS